MGDQNQIRKFDPDAGRLAARLRPGRFPVGVVEHEGAIWAAAMHRHAGGGYVARIDPMTNEFQECLRIGRIQGEFLAIAGDTMWIASFTNNRIVALDLARK
jgi:sugar lactone lactonase YvrE